MTLSSPHVKCLSGALYVPLLRTPRFDSLQLSRTNSHIATLKARLLPMRRTPPEGHHKPEARTYGDTERYTYPLP